MAIVTLRYWAAAKEAAGVAEDKVSAPTLAAALAAGLAAVAAREQSAEPDQLAESGQLAESAQPARDRVERLRLVLARSSFLIDGNPVGVRPPESVTLSDAAVIEVLPPFAGG
jgi:molybdopterin synthase sulfur carrier subunit